MNVGDVLASKYRVEGVLGMGGMGVVVAATHLDLEQRVALKFLLPEGASDPSIVERFLREARASVRLKSPHVARTLDTGRLEDGCPFIVMELLEGRDLDAEVFARRGVLSVEEAASYVLQACDAIAEAHAVGIVHRDLKPANLFLSRGHDGRPQVKVLDFGISKVTHGGGGSMTTTASVFGSPAYMSPEQMRSSKEVDARTDIWSVGVVLYELATGRLPFDAPTALEIGLKASQDEPARPTALVPELPEGFERVILRCLEKDPARRFAAVADLAVALAPFAHPRDRAIAERIVDVARAGALRTSEPGLAGAPEAPPEASVDRLHLALDETHLALDETPLARDKTQPAVTTEARIEPRGIGRPVAAISAVAAVAIIVAGGLAVQRLGRAPETSAVTPAPPAVSSAIRAPSPAEPGPGSAPPSTSSALPEPTAVDHASNVVGVPSAAPVAAARAQPHTGAAAKVQRPVPSAPAAPVAPASAGDPPPAGAPDAGRFFRVRE